MNSKRRVAQFRIDSVQRTDQGALKVKANLTKTGVFDYRLPSGDVVREYRSPEEVFKQEALDSLHGSPVTLLHPSEFVTTGNWDFLAVGSVIAVEPNEPYVSGTLLIHDERVIEKIEAGDLKEISCGYTADIVEAPEGVQHYDAVQQKIHYNHAAIGPAEWGRLGSDVALRLDSESQILLEQFQMSEQIETKIEDKAPESDVNDKVEDSKPEEKPEFDLVAAFEGLTAKFDQLLERLDSANAEETPSEELETSEAEEKEDSDVDIEALVQERANLLDSVRSSYRVLCPEGDVKGKTIEALCLEGLKTVDASAEGRDEEALVGMLEAAAKAKASVKVQDAKDPEPSFAERLTKQRFSEPVKKSFADKLVESVS